MAATTVLPRPKAYDDTFFKPISIWLTTTDHKLIGIMYMVTGILSFVVGGIFALIIRLQLSQPERTCRRRRDVQPADLAHGVTMIFFFVTIFLTGIANYMVPIMIGARDMAFPRVNLLGFWLVPVSIILYYSGFFTGGALDAGWTGYAPLTEKAYQSHSLGVDFWAMSIIVWAISGIMASTNFLTTIVALRAPGMKLTRLPLFVWAQISTSILLLVVGAPLAAAMILLEFDRQLGTQFFTTQGRPVLYQHLFWFFGHPEVYIMILPGFGMISEIIPVFARKPIFGYMSMVMALFGIVFLSMTVWAHHMFTVGMNTYVEGFFMLMTMLIAVPTGIKFFNWIATAWWGSIEFTVPMKFVFGFLATFLIGGITGIYLASVPVDTQLHQSYYVVAHLHYVLFGGSVFTIFAGHLLLVPEDHGPPAQPHAWRVELLDAVHRVQRNLPDHAHTRPRGHASPHRDLHQPGVGHHQHDHHRLVVPDRLLRAAVPDQHREELARRRDRGQRPLGRQHPRVGDDLASAALQLRAGAAGSQLHAAARPARFGRVRRPGAETSSQPECALVVSFFGLRVRGR